MRRGMKARGVAARARTKAYASRVDKDCVSKAALEEGEIGDQREGITLRQRLSCCSGLTEVIGMGGLASGGVGGSCLGGEVGAGWNSGPRRAVEERPALSC